MSGSPQEALPFNIFQSICFAISHSRVRALQKGMCLWPDIWLTKAVILCKCLYRLHTGMVGESIRATGKTFRTANLGVAFDSLNSNMTYKSQFHEQQEAAQQLRALGIFQLLGGRVGRGNCD